mgnify:FL=1
MGGGFLGGGGVKRPVLSMRQCASSRIFCAQVQDRRTCTILLGGIGSAKLHRNSMPRQPLPRAGFGNVAALRVTSAKVGRLKKRGNSGNSGNTSRKPKRGKAFQGSMLFPLSVHLVGTVGTLPAFWPSPCADWRRTLTPRFLRGSCKRLHGPLDAGIKPGRYSARR